jgi:hypothetical protein
MSKKITFIIAGIAGVLVLAGAAFMAMRLLATGQVMDGLGSGTRMQIMGGGPTGAKMTYNIDINPAPELPKQSPQANGIITTLNDNSFMVQGGGKVLVSKSSDGTINAQSDGPSTEIVITQKTIIYRDATFDTHSPVNGEKVQQVIEPFAENQIEKNNIARVWGSKSGDRLIADVILITLPVMLKQRGGD